MARQTASRIAFLLGGAVALALAVGLFSVWAPDVPLASLTSRWAPPPSQFRTIDRVLTHLRDEGPRADTTPILLLHGTSASLHTWDGWTSALTAERRVIRADLPGYGLSGQFKDGESAARYTQWMRALLDSLAITRVIVAGNSLGGRLAWALTVADTTRVVGLVLVDASGYPARATSVPLGFRIAQMPVVKHLAKDLLPRGIIVSSLENVYGDPTRVSEELIDRYYDLARREGNRDALVRRFSSGMSNVDTLAIAGVRVPTLILWGMRDRLIPPANAERFARDIAGSRIVRFDALGHVPHEEDPAMTVAPIISFVAGIR
jgi:pimeloyl-ACP methyl ester carboxylesterase